MMEFDTHQQSTRQPEALTVSDTTGSTAADIYILNLGDYPVDDGDLNIAPGIWMAGDLCGRFRGIVASMISGRYVGCAVALDKDGRAGP